MLWWMILRPSFVDLSSLGDLELRRSYERVAKGVWLRWRQISAIMQVTGT
jgi:hypothetical protein